MATGARQSAVAKVAASKKRNIMATASSLRFGFNVPPVAGQQPDFTMCPREEDGGNTCEHVCGEELCQGNGHEPDNFLRLNSLYTVSY
jgi:hypothetical protein